MNIQNVLTVWTLAAAGVQLGTLWIMKTSIIPMLDALPYNRYVTTCQLIDMHMFHPIAVWNGVITAGIGVWAALLAPTTVTATLFVTGSIAMVLVGLTSEIFNRPIWRQIEHWSPKRNSDEQWGAKRVQWHLAHDVRTWGAMAAVAAFVSAFLAQGA